MDTNDTIRFWACLTISMVNSAAANVLDGMGKPSGFNTIMSFVWMAFVIIQIAIVILKKN